MADPLLRRWQPSDREPFAAMNADPQVMRYFAGTQSRGGPAALNGGTFPLAAVRRCGAALR